MKKIAVFASGSGTNAENLILYFRENPEMQVTLIVCNKPGAGVLQRAERLNVPSILISREDWQNAGRVVEVLQSKEIDFVVLAGFLWLVPKELIRAYPDKILNIHPALLPKYGGKGMYGSNVHEAVHRNQEKESGITIHFVNEIYDSGEIVFRKSFPINPETDTPTSIAEKVHELEYQYFPRVVEEVVRKLS